MNQQLLLLTGPTLGVLALFLFAIPCLRPKALTKGIGWICVSMFIPFGIAYYSNSYNILLLALLIKPITALIGIAISLGYFALCRNRHFPVITIASSILIFVGGFIDLYAVYVLGPGFDGGHC